MERLQKVMAHAGVASRRKSEDLIEAGRVKVNGKVVDQPGFKVDPEQDIIEVDNQEIAREKKVYILLHKPEGVICTADDPRGRKTVLDLVGDIPQRIYPAGRLDYDSSGLVLLTNDGKLTYLLTHPSHQIDKTYLVEVVGSVADEKIASLARGIYLEDGLTAPAEVKVMVKESNKTIFLLTIHEGRNRQVRRMCRRIGHQVKSLQRVAISFLKLGNLAAGEYRHLSDDEVKRLKNG